MCNTAVERASLGPGSKRYVNQYLERIAAAFRSALDNAKQNGDIDTSINIDTLAGFFTTLLIGFAASVRAEASPEQVRTAYEVVLTTIDGLLS